MNYRHALLMAPEDLGASGTKVIPINVDQPISRIEIRFKTTKVLSHMTAPGPANIPKIELVSGSDKLHSLSGYENQALAYYSHPGISMEHGQHIPTQSEVDIYHIDFGRKLYDPQLAFLPPRHLNPRLEIQYNEALADTSCTTNEMEVWLHLFDEKQVAPIGFLSAIEHDSFTPGASGSYKDTLLPMDRPIRQMLLRAYYAAKAPWYEIAEARLDENNLGRVPWEYTDLETYYRRQKAVTPLGHTPFIAGVTTSARVFYLPWTDFWCSVGAMGIVSDSSIYTDGASLEGGYASLLSGADRQQVGEARGYLPWHCFQFPLGNQDEIEDWYNPAGKSPRLRTRSSTGGVSGTCQVVLELLRKYA